MTDPNDLRRAESRGVDTDRMDGGNRLWRPTALTIAGGLVLGAVVGGVIGATRAPSYDATTALSVLPDSVIDTGQQNTTTPDLDATAYIQGQLVSLNGTEVANTVKSRLRLASAPSVTATQVGQTYVVDVTATASTEAEAKAIATATGAAYKQLRATALTASINQSLRSTNARLATVQNNLADAQKGAKPGANVTPAQTALQTEYERLLTLNSSLNLALPQVGQLVTVQSPANVVPVSLSPTLLYGAVGALIGAVLGVIGLVVYRRMSPRVRTVGDVVDLGVPVLLPVVPRAGRRSRGTSAADAWRSSSIRLVAARLASQAEHRVLIVVGATTKVGASHTAAGLAAAAAGRGPVLLVQAAGSSEADPSVADVAQVVGSRLPGVWLLPGAGRLAGADAQYSAQSDALIDVVRRASESGWFVVIDAPALADSDLALDCLATADSIAALVVARGLSRPADVLSAAELFETRDGHFAGVVLNDALRGPRASRSKKTADLTAASSDPVGGTTDATPTIVDASGQANRQSSEKQLGNDSTGDELARQDDGVARDSVTVPPSHRP